MKHKKKKKGINPSAMRCQYCGGTVVLRSADGIYHENHSHTMYIHTVDGSTYMTKAYSLSTLSEELDNDFIRCHKKYIVAIRQIRAYDKATAMITLGSLRLPVGRTFMPDFEKCFLLLAVHSH